MYGILDPRKTPEAQANNNTLLGEKTLGIEVTIPELAVRCKLGNIDPQHSQNKQQAAIEAALEYPLPSNDVTLVTVRADLDSIGAMAALEIRKDYEWAYAVDPIIRKGDYMVYNVSPFSITEYAFKRLQEVAKADAFQNGNWQPYPLPTKENPWPAKNASAGDIKELAAIAAAVADFKISVEDRVKWMINWLLFGKEPEGYREKVEKERMEMIEALENGQIKIQVIEENMQHNVSVVESTHRAGTMLGYSQAPIVVAINPEFKFQGGEPHCKVTVCQFTNHYCDLKAVADRMNMSEPGWGGSLTIIGSPQGHSTEISVNVIITAIQENIR